jgi:PAS domain S-box-containing protein
VVTGPTIARSSSSKAAAALQSGRPLHDVLVEALGDPSIEIVYRLDPARGLGGRGWVDPQGRGVPEPVAEPGRDLKVVELAGEPIAALTYDSASAPPALVEGIAAATALSFQNERLQAELRAEVRLTGTLAETAPGLLSNVDTDGRILKVNLAAVRAAGYSREEEVVGKFFWDVFIDAAEREEMIARFRALAPDFPPGEYENTFTNARGERRVIYWHTAPVLDEGGRVVSIVGGGLDRTDRERLEEEKQREREFLYAIANDAPSLICVVDEEGRVINRRWDVSRGVVSGATNTAFERTLGFDSADTGGHLFWERFVDPADADQVREIIERVIAGAEPTEHDNVWVTSSGEQLHVAWSCTPLPKVDERTLFLVSGTDVSERKRRELELARARDFLQAVVTTIPSLLVVVDHEAQITKDGVNREFSSTFGWSIEEATGRSFLELVHPDDDYSVRMAIAAAANGVARTDLEARWLRQNGEACVVAWTATPARDRDGRGRVLLSGIDVTDRKRQEEELRASRARLIEAESEARRQLERNLHDGAQQRLVALSVQLRLVEAKLRDNPDEAARLLASSREELAQALEELRELARGIHPAVLTDRGLGPALESLVGRAPFPVELDAPVERLAPPVEAAAYYVVAEGLTNVAKYAQASSAVVRVGYEDDVLVVLVSDDGVGGADPAGGSGLRGLADRLAALDGIVTVESPTGGGTTVRAEIPLSSAAIQDVGSADALVS